MNISIHVRMEQAGPETRIKNVQKSVFTPAVYQSLSVFNLKFGGEIS